MESMKARKDELVVLAVGAVVCAGMDAIGACLLYVVWVVGGEGVGSGGGTDEGGATAPHEQLMPGESCFPHFLQNFISNHPLSNCYDNAMVKRINSSQYHYDLLCYLH